MEILYRDWSTRFLGLCRGRSGVLCLLLLLLLSGLQETRWGKRLKSHASCSIQLVQTHTNPLVRIHYSTNFWNILHANFFAQDDISDQNLP